nr:NfeD family protein [bacterium]
MLAALSWVGAEWTALAIVLMVIGFGLIILEMFIPGFGLPGTLGTISLLAGIVLKSQTFMEGLLWFVGSALLLGVVLLIVVKSATNGRLAKTPLILKAAATTEGGFISNEDLSAFKGKIGTTLTVLRPAGVGVFDGVRLDIVSEGDFLPANAQVQIVAVEGCRIVVRLAPQS